MISIKRTVFTVLVFSLFRNTPTAQTAEEFNPVDAVTSASIYHSVRIDSGKAYRTKADIYWWERYTNKDVRAYLVRWGTSPGVFTDTLDIFDLLRPRDDENRVTKLFTIKPLLENTHYYCQFYRDYNGDIDLMNFTLCTYPLQCESSISAGFAVKRDLRNAAIDAVDVYTIDGRCILHAALNTATPGLLIPRTLPAGLYIAHYTRARLPVRSEKILIE